tara:strand:+ start:66 stop:692 length:627 start_codon:yes stop_codon:yes gene_type:complete
MPLIFGLYLIAGIVGKASAKYAVKKIGEKVSGKLLSRHTRRDLATKAKNVLSASKDTGKPMSFKNLPASSKAKFQDISGKPYSMTQPKTPGVTYGGGSPRSAVIGQQRVRDYTLGRRIEGAVVGAGATAGAIKGVDALINRIKKAKTEDAPTGSLKKQFINAVKSKTDDPKKIAQARTDFDEFVTGKKRSLKFNYGGMVKKTRKKRKK